VIPKEGGHPFRGKAAGPSRSEATLVFTLFQSLSLRSIEPSIFAWTLPQGDAVSIVDEPVADGFGFGGDILLSLKVQGPVHLWLPVPPLRRIGLPPGGVAGARQAFAGVGEPSVKVPIQNFLAPEISGSVGINGLAVAGCS
jgi:hypothetical protein